MSEAAHFYGSPVCVGGPVSYQSGENPRIWVYDCTLLIQLQLCKSCLFLTVTSEDAGCSMRNVNFRFFFQTMRNSCVMFFAAMCI